MKSFEIEVCERGNWRHDSLFDDKPLALSQAERLASKKNFSGIRIVCEEYDEVRDKSKHDYIYIRKPPEMDDGRSSGVRGSAHEASSSAPRTPASSRKKKEGTPMWLTAIVSVFVVVAAAGIAVGAVILSSGS